MNRQDADSQLACLLLTGCRMAQQAGHAAVAEHLICAIEALVESVPSEQDALDQAYLLMLENCNRARSGRNDV